jgi:hypothetical protein
MRNNKVSYANRFKRRVARKIRSAIETIVVSPLNAMISKAETRLIAAAAVQEARQRPSPASIPPSYSPSFNERAAAQAAVQRLFPILRAGFVNGMPGILEFDAATGERLPATGRFMFPAPNWSKDWRFKS